MATIKESATNTAMIALNWFFEANRERFADSPKALEQIAETEALAKTKDESFWAPLVAEVEGHSQHARAMHLSKALAAEIQAK